MYKVERGFSPGIYYLKIKLKCDVSPEAIQVVSISELKPKWVETVYWCDSELNEVI